MYKEYNVQDKMEKGIDLFCFCWEKIFILIKENDELKLSKIKLKLIKKENKLKKYF